MSKHDSSVSDEETPSSPGLDRSLSLYELTDLFYSFYRYHNDEEVFSESFLNLDPTTKKISTVQRSFSRFASIRRVNAGLLGARPHFSGQGISVTKPNVNLGYLKLLTSYIALPFKSFFVDGEVVKIQINRKLLDKETLDEEELDRIRMEEKNSPGLFSNGQVSADTTTAFLDILRTSRKFQKCREQTPTRVVVDGIMGWLNNGIDWDPEPIHALDLVTEPLCEWDPENWSSFFVIREITAAEATRHIREETSYWNAEALRWALESTLAGRNFLDRRHYTGRSSTFSDPDERACGENFMVRSFYNERSQRVSNIGSYYGKMLVVESYYLNVKGKVDKAILFISADMVGKDVDKAKVSKVLAGKAETEEEKEIAASLEGANVLFHRSDVFDSISEAITVIPYDRAEPSLERQRPPAFELFPITELVSRLDCSIFNLAIIMGTPMIKNLNSGGTDAESMEEIEVRVDGEIVDIGGREFVNTHYQADLGSMISVRTMALQHAASKAFLGGLDGTDMKGEGRGAQLASLRLSRDGRIYKDAVEHFSMGVRDGLKKSFKFVLDQVGKTNIRSNLLEKKFFSVLTKICGHDENIFSYEKDDVLEDTGLPYWMSFETVRSGASHFGAAEQVIYSELKSVWGDVMTQKQLQSFARKSVRGVLGNEDAIDIFGDPKDEIVVDQDQIYRATMENAAICGSVDQGAMHYEQIGVLPEKDDHFIHLSQVHNPLLQQMLEMLQSGQTESEGIDDLTEDVLSTRVNVILRAAALATHISPHMEGLSMFGTGRDDVAELLEQTNQLLQAAEGLTHSLQVHLRSLQQKRQEKEERLRGMSPESEAERMKIDLELQKLQAKSQVDAGKLDLANKIAADRQAQHRDKQLSKSRDRALKREVARDNSMNKQEELQVKREEVSSKVQMPGTFS